jgi:hypothetical protein
LARGTLRNVCVICDEKEEQEKEKRNPDIWMFPSKWLRNRKGKD